MSNQTVSVPTGATPTLINTGLNAGSIIYNQDTANTVWVSSNPSIVSGQGIPLGPLGSLTWNGGVVYAVAGTGVTTGTQLNISSDVGNLDNPVAIGAAVAAQLLATGIPSVLIGKSVFSGVIAPMPSPGISWVVPVSIGQYASLAMSFQSTVNQSITIAWVDSVTGQTISSRRYMLAAYPVDANQLKIETPVKADEMHIFFTDYTAGSVTLQVYASNRALPERIAGTPPYYQGSIAGTAYAAYQSMTFDKAFYSPGGNHTIHLTPNGANAAGYFGMYGIDVAGAQIGLTIIDSSMGKAGTGTETEINVNVNMPAGYYRLFWQNGGTAQTYSTTVNIFPPT